MSEQSLFLRAIHKKPIERTPVWMMRQAGRYLPEYRKIREVAGNFLSLCKNPELACEVTLQPLRRFSLDAAILFSDILTIPDAMGLGLHFIENEGPQFTHPVATRHTIDTLRVTNAEEDLSYVIDAVRLIRHEMPSNLPLIGFAGSPWTLACYAVEGGSSRDFKRVLRLMYEESDAMHMLLKKFALSICNYLDMQVQAGVNALMIFDTWGGILSTSRYQAFSLQYMRMIIQYLKEKHPNIPIILFTKGGGKWLRHMAAAECDVLGLDWTIDLGTARLEVGEKVALQGNLDPSVLLTNPDCIRKEVETVLTSYGHGSGHIFNLGHGITPDVPVENVQAMLDAVAEISPQFHKNV